MKHAENFLFSISGVTCSKQLADQGPNLLFVSTFQIAFFSNIQSFQCSLQLCSLFIVYLLTKIIRSPFSIFGIRSYLGGLLELLSHYFQTDHSDHLICLKTIDLLATSSLRATKRFLKYLLLSQMKVSKNLKQKHLSQRRK